MKNINLIRILNILDKFNEQNIAVVGDLMLDRYIFGKVERISPEAPVPVVNVTHEKKVPGGAANVALNLVKMQAGSLLGGLAGIDLDGDCLLRKLRAESIDTRLVLQTSEKPTTRKVRIIGYSQNLLRIDYESSNYLSSTAENQLLTMIKDNVESGYLILSDYAKGTLTPHLLSSLVKWSHQNDVKIIIDPKPVHKKYYKGAYLVKPNKKEAQEMTGIKITDNASLIRCGEALMQELKSKIVITLGEDGMAIFDEQQEPHKIPTRAREVYDVSGAGDTVTAALTLALSSGANLKEAAEIANCAGGIKVSKVGTHPVSLEEIISFIKSSV